MNETEIILGGCIGLIAVLIIIAYWWKRKEQRQKKIAEQGHYLASAMISSRAIAYTSDQIKGKNDEEKVQYLVDNGIIKKDRKDEQKQLMSSMRLSRNFLSHRIDLFSDSGNVLVLIGGTITLSRILLSLKTV